MYFARILALKIRLAKTAFMQIQISTKWHSNNLALSNLVQSCPEFSNLVFGLFGPKRKYVFVLFSQKL